MVGCYARSDDYLHTGIRPGHKSWQKLRGAQHRPLPRGHILLRSSDPSTTVVDRMRAEAIRAFDSGSTWPGIGVVFATGTNAAGVQCRATRATAFR
jgi:hypothetical protein